MSTDTNKPAPVAEPASEDCIDTALSTMQTALRAAWEGDYTKSARYVELTATRLEARDQHNPAKWLRIALEEMQGKRQPVAVHAMSVPAPAVDERIAQPSDKDMAVFQSIADNYAGHLAAAPKQQLHEPVAWMHNGYVSKNKGRVLHDEQNNRSCGFKAQPVHALYTADQLRTAIAAERELRAASEERQALCLALTRDAQDIAATAQAELSTLRQQLERTRPAPLSDERIVKVFLRAASDRAGFVTLEAGKPSVYMVDIVRMVERALFEGE